MAMRNLSKYMDPSYPSPPTDVKFLFKEEGVSATKEVKAHKMILAFASDVFNREFYGSMESEDEIPIKDASQEAFQAMIDFIYKGQLNWKEYDLSVITSLYYLAEKYNVDNMKNMVIASIPEQEVTKDNVLSIAILAEDSILHQPLSEALYDVAASFIKKDFNGKLEDLHVFTEANEKHALIIFKVMKQVKKIRSPTCENCNQSSCLDGQNVTLQKFVEGASVSRTAARKLVRIVSEHSFTARNEDGTEIMGLSLNPYGHSQYVYNCFKQT
eukprot:GFUD01107191.1.p1 GENE.GFUD01107191.1~~GFUD01107191.1.p1  ORF type:complete len:284 (-),score=76.20 GFUD01107191.1:86-898(-)